MVRRVSRPSWPCRAGWFHTSGWMFGTGGCGQRAPPAKTARSVQEVDSRRARAAAQIPDGSARWKFGNFRVKPRQWFRAAPSDTGRSVRSNMRPSGSIGSSSRDFARIANLQSLESPQIAVVRQDGGDPVLAAQRRNLRVEHQVAARIRPECGRSEEPKELGARPHDPAHMAVQICTSAASIGRGDRARHQKRCRPAAHRPPRLGRLILSTPRPSRSARSPRPPPFPTSP